MEEKKFLKPELEIVVFGLEDILTTSGGEKQDGDMEETPIGIIPFQL